MTRSKEGGKSVARNAENREGGRQCIVKRTECALDQGSEEMEYREMRGVGCKVIEWGQEVSNRYALGIAFCNANTGSACTCDGQLLNWGFL
jgi:hypothetical protein